MWRRFLCGFANVFVVSYAIDSAISVIYVCAQIGLGSHAVPSGLTELRSAAASAVIGWGTLTHALFGNPGTSSDVEEFEAPPNS